MSCEHRDAMAALALGALSEREAEAARRHAETCEECRPALARHQATVGVLEAELPRVAPPPLDVARVRPERRRGPSQRLLVAAMAAAVAVILVLALGRGQTGSAPRATLTPGNAGGQTHGEARITGPGRGGSYLVFDVSVQRDGGPKVNSGIHLASGAFEQRS